MKTHIKTFLFIYVLGLIPLSIVAIYGQDSEFFDPYNLIKKDATLNLVSDSFKFTEGPASDKNGNVYFTDQPNNRILKWNAKSNTVTTFLEPAGRSNGLYFNKNGNLLACADENFELWEINLNKKITVLLDNYEDQKLNGPNDLWIDKRGGIYFTDPYYQRPYWKRTEQDIKSQNVYYFSPNRKNFPSLHVT